MTNRHSLQTIKDLKPGDHLCCIYETDKEHRQVLTPFIVQGLQQGEKVLYISDAHAVETVLGYLRDDGVDAVPYLDSGQLVFVSSAETYLSFGAFDPDRMIRRLRAETEQSLTEGYSALRVTGEMTWAQQTLRDPEPLIAYENKLNVFLPGSQCLAICQYDRRRFDPAVLLSVLRTHPVAVIGTESYDNFYYVPPADLLSSDPASAELAHCVQNLAERKHMEQTLRESEGTARALLNATTDLAAVLDTSGILLDLNEAMARNWSRPADELIGVNVWDLLPPEVTEHRKPYGDQVVQTGKPVRFEDERQGIWFDSIVYPVLDAQGAVTRIAVHSRDITERVRGEMALREGELLTRALLNAHTDLAAVLDTAGNILDVNEAMARSLGRHRAELVGVNGWELLSPDLGEQRKAYGERAIQSGKSVRFEDERQGLWFDNVLFPILDDQGAVTRIAVHSRDITERMRTEMALRESEMTARALLNSHTDLAAVLEPSGIILDINEAMARRLGRPLDELVGVNVWELFPPDVSERRKAYSDQVVQSRKPVRFEDERQGVWFDNVCYPVLDAQGQVTKIAVHSRDITERVRAEMDLRDTKELFEKTFVTQQDAILLLDGKNPPEIIDCNPATELVFGYTRQEMLGRTTAFLHANRPAFRKFRRHLDRAVKERRHLHLPEFQMKHKDGTVFPTEHSVMPIQDEQGKRSGWVGVVRDVTDRVRANEEAIQHREQLAHIMRVASMGEMTASLAHELNQPLTAIVSNAQAAQRFLARDAPDLDEVRGALADIAEDGLRAGSVIRGLRALLRKGERKHEPLDINAIVSEAVPHIQSEAALNGVSIELQLAKELPLVSGDPIQLEQVILNLLLNGIEALSDLDIGARELVVRTEQATPLEVELTVLDSGAGLDDQIQDRIFDPFFSTKPAGLGMGLTISRSIVRAHNGRLSAAQNPGGGAAFHVHLPACRENLQ